MWGGDTYCLSADSVGNERILVDHAFEPSKCCTKVEHVAKVQAVHRYLKNIGTDGKSNDLWGLQTLSHELLVAPPPTLRKRIAIKKIASSM